MWSWAATIICTGSPIAGERARVLSFGATLGYSPPRSVAAFRHGRQSSWFLGLEGAFQHCGGVTDEVN